MAHVISVVNPLRRGHAIIRPAGSPPGSVDGTLFFGDTPMEVLREAVASGQMVMISSLFKEKTTKAMAEEISATLQHAVNNNLLISLPTPVGLDVIGAVRYDQTNITAALIIGKDPKEWLGDLAELYQAYGMDGEASAQADMEGLKSARTQVLLQKQNLTQNPRGREE